MIERELRHLDTWAHRQALRPIVSDLRQKVETIRRAELARACLELAEPDGDPSAVLDRLTRRLLDQVLAIPLAAACRADLRDRRGRGPLGRRRRWRGRRVTRIRIGTRGSALALWQAREIAVRLAAVAPGVAIELVEITSTGDTVTELPLAQVEGTGFFTASIERALAGGEVDVAVHSHKDLPVDTAPGLTVAAVPMRGPIEDVLCARDGYTLSTLPPGARIGTCSTRRTAQVLARRPDLDVQVLRGNVPTRVARLAEGRLDAVVLARAGLQRLGLEQHITEVFSLAEMLPAPAQGALAVQCRDRRPRAARAAVGPRPRADPPRRRRRAGGAARPRRRLLGAGGRDGVGDGDAVILTAGAFAVDGTHAIRVESRGADPDAVGAAAARQLLAQGAGVLLAACDRVARLDAPAPAEARS